ncbi:MAG: DUF4126 domain-containing protein [Phycisphaerales bacterium]
METLASILLGLGISAACGLRVFLPMLVMCLGATLGLFEPSKGFEWVTSWEAITVLSVACVFEIAAYYVPVVDHAMDAIKIPAAFAAAALATAAHMGDFHPVITWGGALIAGGVASTVNLGTATLRAGSTTTTGGLANPLLATLENALAAAVSVLAVAVPIALGVLSLLVLALGVWIALKLSRRRARNRVRFA